jgi:hypothetical protein
MYRPRWVLPTKAVVPDALTPEDRQRIVSGLVDVVRPTLEQVMEYSPNTQRIVYAVRSGGGVKRAAAKKKAAPKKAAVKKSAARKATRKSASRRMAR